MSDYSHVTRNWRSRLEKMADEWLLTEEAAELSKPSNDPVKRRANLRQAYIRGHSDCRAITQKRREEHAIAKLKRHLGDEKDPQKRKKIATDFFGEWGLTVLDWVDNPPDEAKQTS